MKRRDCILVIMGAAAIGCSKTSGGGAGAAVSAAGVDALWVMAPKDADAGVVVSPRALHAVEAALVRLEQVGKAAPPIGELVQQLEAKLGAAVPGGHLTRWADAGLSADRGFALFHVRGGDVLLVVPVADHDRFLAATGGHADKDGDHLGRTVCRAAGDRTLCSDDVKLLDATRAEPEGRRASTLHGDLEVWVARSLLAAPPGAELTGDLYAAATIAPGVATARVHVPMKGAMFESFAKADRVKAPGADTAAGFFIANLAPALAAMPRPRGDVVGIPEALRALAGPITVVAPAGALDLDARVALHDADTIAPLVAGCDRLVTPGGGITATPKDGGCRVHVETPIAPGRPGFDFDVWVDGDTLRASHDRGSPPRATADVAPTEIGKELGDGSWSVVAWGRGALTRTMVTPTTPEPIYAAPFVALCELGIGVRVGDDGVDGLVHVRTIWDNPDDVVAALLPVIAKAVHGDDIAADVAAVAAKFPDSAYAADAKSGQAGLMVPTALIGMLSAVAIPAFLDYMHAGRRTEAELELRRLGKRAKTYYAENASFPVGAERATPAASCCAQPGHRCAAAPADWRTAEPGHPWAALDFEVLEDGRFQYDYQGTADGFVAHAIADLDCDGAGTTTYTLRGRADNGVPTVEVLGPTGDD